MNRSVDACVVEEMKVELLHILLSVHSKKSKPQQKLLK